MISNTFIADHTMCTTGVFSLRDINGVKAQVKECVPEGDPHRLYYITFDPTSVRYGNEEWSAHMFGMMIASYKVTIQVKKARSYEELGTYRVEEAHIVGFELMSLPLNGGAPTIAGTVKQSDRHKLMRHYPQIIMSGLSMEGCKFYLPEFDGGASDISKWESFDLGVTSEILRYKGKPLSLERLLVMLEKGGVTMRINATVDFHSSRRANAVGVIVEGPE